MQALLHLNPVPFLGHLTPMRLICHSLCMRCQDRTIRLWNPHKGIPVKVYTGHGYEVCDWADFDDDDIDQHYGLKKFDLQPAAQLRSGREQSDQPHGVAST